MAMDVKIATFAREATWRRLVVELLRSSGLVAAPVTAAETPKRGGTLTY